MKDHQNITENCPILGVRVRKEMKEHLAYLGQMDKRSMSYMTREAIYRGLRDVEAEFRERGLLKEAAQ